jgi:hypothetical protein
MAKRLPLRNFSGEGNRFGFCMLAIVILLLLMMWYFKNHQNSLPIPHPTGFFHQSIH